MKRYCVQGHDTTVVGRTTWRYCAECNRQRNRSYYRDNAVRVMSQHEAYRATTAGILSELRYATRRRREKIDAEEV